MESETISTETTQPETAQPETARTEAQQVASRSNGAKSQGPTTEAGKRRSSQNARKNDFFTRIHLLPGEDQEEFDNLLSALSHENDPQSFMERHYIHEMADAMFRLRRVRAHAADIQAKAAEDMSDAFEKLAEEGKSLQLALRYEKHFQRQFDNAVKMLLAIRRLAIQEFQARQKQENLTRIKDLEKAVLTPDPILTKLNQDVRSFLDAMRKAQQNEPKVGQ